MEYSDPKWHWNAQFATPEAKQFLGEDPRPPLQEDVSFGLHLTNTYIHHRVRHLPLSDFFVKTHFDP